MSVYAFDLYVTVEGFPDGTPPTRVYMESASEEIAKKQEVFDEGGYDSEVWLKHCPPCHRHGTGTVAFEVHYVGEASAEEAKELLQAWNRVIYHSSDMTPAMYECITGDTSGEVPAKPTEAEWLSWRKDASILIDNYHNMLEKSLSEIGD